MRQVAIAACGMTKFSKNDSTIESTLAQSARDLFQKHDVRYMIDTVLVSTNANEKYLSQILSEYIGVSPNISHTVESMCSSGTSAILSAYSYISSGMADVILVSGADRYDSPGRVLSWDDSRGEFLHPTHWASLYTHAYREKHSIPLENLAIIPVKNHKQAAYNPYALSKKQYTINDVTHSKHITNEIRLLDCSRPCTGGASVLLASKDVCKKITDTPIWITGIGQKTTSAGFTKTKSYHTLESTQIAATTALHMAGHTPDMIDVAEIHDAFSVCEPMALESIGMAKKGAGTTLAKTLHDTNDFMINPRGGLLGSGHPLGATGIAQSAEIFTQLSGMGGKRQVDNPQIGLVHNMAAAGTTSAVLILER